MFESEWRIDRAVIEDPSFPGGEEMENIVDKVLDDKNFLVSISVPVSE